MAIQETTHPPEFEPSGFSQISQFPETTAGYVVERRKAGYHPPCAMVIGVQDRLMRGDTVIHAIRTAQDELKSDTAEVLEILNNAKAFFRFAKFAGRMLAFFTPLVALFLAWKGLVK